MDIISGIIIWLLIGAISAVILVAMDTKQNKKIKPKDVVSYVILGLFSAIAVFCIILLGDED